MVADVSRFLFIVVVIFIIIAIIYKNENPMVCLLALWVHKCLFFPEDQQFYLYKIWIFPYFLCH